MSRTKSLFFLCLFAPFYVFGENSLVVENTSVELDEGGFATLRVRLSEAPAAPVTVTYGALSGGADNIYLRTQVGIRIHYEDSQPQGDLLRLELYDQETPLTVANFLDYLTAGDYNGSFFHRLVHGFVIQGGGFKMVEEGAEFLAERIPTNDPVLNEPGISNLPGTVAMAKLGGDPNSATNQWFINLADNSDNLDNQNGGFTVFANVLDEDMDIVADLAALNTQDLSDDVTGDYASALGEVPVHDLPSPGDFDLDNLVTIQSASVLPKELVFTDQNYNQWQEVRVHAAPDSNFDDGTRTIRFSAAEMTPRDVLVQDRDTTLSIIVQEGTDLQINEDGIATFHVRLSRPPTVESSIQIQWQSGDPDIWEATFATIQTPLGYFDVELYDHLASDTVAYFRHYALYGFWDSLFFHENDLPGNQLRAARFGNDGSNYSYTQQVTYFPDEIGSPPVRGNLVVRSTTSGAEDLAPHWYVSTAASRAAGADVVFGKVLDNGMDIVDRITALPTFDLETYLEDFNPGLELGGVMENTPMHSWNDTGSNPPTEANLVMCGITITSFPMFTTENWDQWHEITFRALKDADFDAGTAVFSLYTTYGNSTPTQVKLTEVEPQLTIELDRENLTVPEGLDEPPAVMGVRLSAPPDALLQVVAQLSTGGGNDPDISLTGDSVIEFDSSDWDTWKYFSFSATEDADTSNGIVTVSLVPSVDASIIPDPPVFTVTEIDDDFTLTLAVDPAGGGQISPTGAQTVDADDLPYVLPLPQADPGHVFHEWVVAGAAADLLSSARRVPTRVLRAESATITARFGADTDGDGLPDPWEASLGFDLALIKPDADPDRDGKTTKEEFFDGTDPLMYQIPLTTGWNGIGMGALAHSDATRDASPFPPGLWHWDGIKYKPVEQLEPFQAGWHFCAGADSLSVPVSLPEPGDRISLHAGWNLILIDQEKYSGEIQDVMGDHVRPAGWAWITGRLTWVQGIPWDEENNKGFPIWVFSEMKQEHLQLQSPSDGRR